MPGFPRRRPMGTASDSSMKYSAQFYPDDRLPNIARIKAPPRWIEATSGDEMTLLELRALELIHVDLVDAAFCTVTASRVDRLDIQLFHGTREQAEAYLRWLEGVLGGVARYVEVS